MWMFKMPFPNNRLAQRRLQLLDAVGGFPINPRIINGVIYVSIAAQPPHKIIAHLPPLYRNAQSASIREFTGCTPSLVVKF